MIAVLVIPPLMGLAFYLGGLATGLGVAFALVCLAIAVVGRAIAT